MFTQNNIVRKQFQYTFYKNEKLYLKRNNVEGIFSALKRTILNKILSKNYITKKREVAFKIIIYNIKKSFSNIFLLENLNKFNKNIQFLK